MENQPTGLIFFRKLEGELPFVSGDPVLHPVAGEQEFDFYKLLDTARPQEFLGRDVDLIVLCDDGYT